MSPKDFQAIRHALSHIEYALPGLSDAHEALTRIDRQAKTLADWAVPRECADTDWRNGYEAARAWVCMQLRGGAVQLGIPCGSRDLENREAQLDAVAFDETGEPYVVPAQQAQPIKSICTDCRHTDSWGLPDRPHCSRCEGGKMWEPLNASSVNPNVTQQAQPTECHKQRNAACTCSRKAMLCDGFGPYKQAKAEAVPGHTLPYERALAELIEKVAPGLDSGDVLADAATASAAISPQQADSVPKWLTYDPATDVLTIHGKRYSAGMFGEEGFLAPPGTLLRVEAGAPDVVTLTKLWQPSPPICLTCDDIGFCIKPSECAKEIERMQGGDL